MDGFEFISVAISFVLGLGVTSILLSALNVFRRRDEMHLHWIPLTWAAIIFLWHLHYWWALLEMDTLVEVWTPKEFVVLILMAVLLFVSGGLILPGSSSHSRQNLIEEFDRNGRWALICLSAYFSVSIWVNWRYFDISPISYQGAIVNVMTVTPIVTVFLRNRSALSIATLLFLAFSCWAALELTPDSY